MEIHEYQTKRLFREFGLPILKGGVAYTPDEAVRAAEAIGGEEWRLKAQIHDNRRTEGFFVEENAGEGGGIRVAHSVREVHEIAGQILGKTLITPTTHHRGHEVKKIYVEEVAAEKERFQLSLQIDIETQQRLLVLVRENGQMKKYELSDKGVTTFMLHRLVNRMKLSGRAAAKLVHIVHQMYKLFSEYKAMAVELVPLILTPDNQLVVLEGRIVFDGNALVSFPEISVLREIDIGTEREITAHMHNFKYTKLNGNIACIVNGFGLGLATIDLTTDKGGAVSCLLDIGTEPTKEIVATAFRMVLSEPDIEGVLVNIFGGATRCDVIAQGLIAASHEISVGMPLVVRMDGTNAAVGARLLQESRLPFETMQHMDEAVERIITRVQEVS